MSKFLSPGETAACRVCKENTEVPKNATSVHDDDYTLWLRDSYPTVAEFVPTQTEIPFENNYHKIDIEREWLIGNPESRHVADYFSLGRESCSGFWGLAVGCMVVYAVSAISIRYMSAEIPLLEFFFSIFVTPILGAGITALFIRIVTRNNPMIENMIDGFYRYGTTLGISAIFSSVFFIIFFCFGLMIGISGISRVEDLPMSLLIPTIVVFSTGFFLVAVFFVFVYPLAMDIRGLGALDSIRYSARIVLPYYWKVLGFATLSAVAIALSILLLVFPAFFVIPIVNASLIRLYLDLRAQFEERHGPLPVRP